MPRGLERAGSLDRLLTDVWWPWGRHGCFGAARRLGGRFHPEVPGEKVRAFTPDFLFSAVRQKVLKTEWFLHEQELNRLFERRCVAALRDLPDDGHPRVLFAYSYAAKGILSYGRERGWRTILGQIDPGPRESEIVLKEYLRLGLAPSRLYRPPEGYWDDWRMEAELADRIMVNSRWSAACLQETGVPAAKIRVVPCAFEARASGAETARSYPAAFSPDRPMRVLFLGQTIIRKGIHLLMKVAEALANQPVRFVVVGDGLDYPDLKMAANVEWVGSVSRDETARCYEQADVFVLPTLSDGFALTQLEAMARRLPVIASRHCGDVVVDGVNGLILPEVTAEALCLAVQKLLEAPGELARLSAHCAVSEEYSIASAGQALMHLAAEC